jgi:hypothetical protein
MLIVVPQETRFYDDDTSQFKSQDSVLIAEDLIG